MNDKEQEELRYYRRLVEKYGATMAKKMLADWKKLQKKWGISSPANWEGEKEKRDE